MKQFIKPYQKTGCGSAWLERLVWDQEVAGSNPVTPTEYAGVVQWSNTSLPSWIRGFDSHHPLCTEAKADVPGSWQ